MTSTGAPATGRPASACTTPRIFSGVESAYAYSYIYTPGYPHPNPAFGGATTITVDLRGVFWSFGGGDPALNGGNDMGTFGPFAPTGSNGQYAAWMYSGGSFYGLLYPAAIYNRGGFANWTDPRVNNCIDRDGSDPQLWDSDQCMVVLLSDQVEGVGYFALFAQATDNVGNYFFNRATNNQRAVLTVIPRPTIVGSTSIGTDVQLEVVVSAPMPGEAVHLNCRPQQNFLLATGYAIYYQIVPRGEEPSSDRALERFVSAGAGGAFGEAATIQVDCSEDSEQDVYLCAALTFDSGFATEVCSEKSTAVQCGPTIGDPIRQFRELIRFEHGAEQRQ